MRVTQLRMDPTPRAAHRKTAHTAGTDTRWQATATPRRTKLATRWRCVRRRPIAASKCISARATTTTPPRPDPLAEWPGGASGELLLAPGDSLVWECALRNNGDALLSDKTQMCDVFGSFALPKRRAPQRVATRTRTRSRSEPRARYSAVITTLNSPALLELPPSPSEDASSKRVARPLRAPAASFTKNSGRGGRLYARCAELIAANKRDSVSSSTGKSCMGSPGMHNSDMGTCAARFFSARACLVSAM
jgi:hypothetical protein